MMAYESRTVTDPLGNVVLLPGDLFKLTPKAGIYDDASAVITKPALLIEINNGNEKEMFYFRSIGWDHTMLIMVGQRNDQWEAVSYQRDPPNELLADIMKKGRQLL
jgi:hypothetical protein